MLLYNQRACKYLTLKISYCVKWITQDLSTIGTVSKNTALMDDFPFKRNLDVVKKNDLYH